MFNKLLAPLKLQLFAEPGEQASEINQEVTELEEQTTDVVADVNQETSEAIETEVAEQSNELPKQTTRDFEKDSAFAKIRREMEEAKKQKEMLAKTFQQFGFKGTPEEIADQANAHYTGKPIEEVRQQRVIAEKQQQEETQRLAELEFYRNKEIERLMNDDLKRIQKLDPTVKALNDLGDDYFNLIKVGVDAEIAYEAVKQKKLRETKTAPPEIGRVNSNTKVEKDYYSPEEVDKMSTAELDNPKIWEKVRNSMTKWK